MTAAIFIYIAEVMNSLGALLGIIGIGGLIVSAIFTLLVYVEDDKYHGRNWTLIAPVICLAVACFIPSSKTMYMMAGAVLGEQALESKVGQKLKEILETKLDQELAKINQEEKK